MERPTQAIFHNAVFLAGSFSGAGPRKRARVEKPKKPAKEQRDITKMSAAEKKKEIARLQAAIKKEEEELERKREKIAALEASILADEADDKLMIEE
ncbi:hypothetical protein BO85DRAFT_520201 [Aspergillus piperis CBS 112811]|uniref:Uncharacterized protein n=1 Tax=Aspergillus piperis CBS 112811 TaxID=1448313 RepID=A0A8G1VL53_9EURO|nr:hypothetical protein BO85DRAFT_520201 [Aspergillus piperis CBS 112811]RAH57454.1 hypothetical protein BO85DRAFT_520201 [Aspergillus piperis CBS 112811]